MKNNRLVGKREKVCWRELYYLHSSAALAGCVFTGASVLWALAGGYLIFCAYGLIRKHSLAELGKMSLSGVKTVRNILMIFGLIGFITALWRASGTIAVIVCWSSKLVSPSAFLVIAFLLNCMVSILTGTSFGTGATMGVICMAMGRAMELEPVSGPARDSFGHLFWRPLFTGIVQRESRLCADEDRYL